MRVKGHANRIHNEVGGKVRRPMRALGGTMPENLPFAESREKKRLEAREASAIHV